MSLVVIEVINALEERGHHSFFIAYICCVGFLFVHSYSFLFYTKIGMYVDKNCLFFSHLAFVVMCE